MEQKPEGELSKKAQKKLEKQQKKADAKAAHKAQEQQVEKKEDVDVSQGNYGVLPLNQSQERSGKTYTLVKALGGDKDKQKVLIRGRVHTVRGQGNLIFLMIRHKFHSVQVVVAKSATVSKKMVSFAASITKESIVDIEGTVVLVKERIETATQGDIEVQADKVFVVSMAASPLPLQIEDAARSDTLYEEQEKEIKKIEAEIAALEAKIVGKEETPEGKELLAQVQKLVDEKGKAQKYVAVNLQTRLDNRVLDLRTQANQAIFKIRSGIAQLFREFLVNQDFTEIHTPKIIGTASEGGAAVFKVKYFDKEVFLAQSPQFYKQMSVVADLERVFEIGPVFRAENSFTHRHLCEFIGLDLEMAFNEHYHEVLEFIWDLFVFIFTEMEKRYQHEIKIVSLQYPFASVKIPPKMVRLHFKEAIALLREAGETLNDLDDLSTPQEKLLGKIMREKYQTDFYIVDKFPLAIRPFYTMPDPVEKQYSNSYDFFLRGEEIMSGSQRVHDIDLLMKRAEELKVGMEGVKDYIQSFKHGAPPHAGGGIGLDRVAMFYLGLKNIRMTSMFPRDPVRVTP